MAFGRPDARLNSAIKCPETVGCESLVTETMRRSVWVPSMTYLVTTGANSGKNGVRQTRRPAELSNQMPRDGGMREFGHRDHETKCVGPVDDMFGPVLFSNHPN
ncbi:hypothetical protein BaRGS_00001756, partial [Batillaria attramentaria]